jgi:hypothetical protein
VSHISDDRADAAAELLSSMKSDIDRWRSGDEIDFQARYESALQSAGVIPVLSAAFLRYEDSTLSGYLNVLTFFWKDLPYTAWIEILYRISESRQAVYQFVWFASRFLRIDIVSIIGSDPKVHDTARELIKVDFPKGAPGYSNWEKEVLEDHGVDPIAMWRRLESEGALMRVAPYELE